MDTGETFQADNVRRWDESYILQSSKNLWGDPSVPFVDLANDVFRGTEGLILDIPCGDGRNMPALAEKNLFVIGADSSVNALRLADQLSRMHEISNVAFFQEDILDLRVMEESVGGIFCCDVLGHLVRVDEALDGLVRRLRRGGVLVGNVFAMEDSTRGPNMSRIGLEEYLFDERFFFRFYDEDRARKLVQSVKLPVELLHFSHVRWTEPPHEGYREYEHEHASWIFALKRL